MFCCAVKPWEHHLHWLSKEKLCRLVLVSLANVSQSCQQNLPGLKRFDTLAIYCGKVSVINNLRTMAGGHAVHERQAILLTTVVIFHTFCMENKQKLTSEGCGNNHVILLCKSAI